MLDLVGSCLQPRKPWRWQGHERPYSKVAINQNAKEMGVSASGRSHLEDCIGSVRKYGDWNSAAESNLARQSRANIRPTLRELM